MNMSDYEKAWQEAIDPRIPTAQLSPAARMLRDTYTVQRILLSAHVALLGHAIVAALPAWLRRLLCLTA